MVGSAGVSRRPLLRSGKTRDTFYWHESKPDVPMFFQGPIHNFSYIQPEMCYMVDGEWFPENYPYFLWIQLNGSATRSSNLSWITHWRKMRPHRTCRYCRVLSSVKVYLPSTSLHELNGSRSQVREPLVHLELNNPSFVFIINSSRRPHGT